MNWLPYCVEKRSNKKVIVAEKKAIKGKRKTEMEIFKVEKKISDALEFFSLSRCQYILNSR
jgi:hypothetical protein